MGQTSSQVVAPTQASQAVRTPAIAKKNAVKRRHEQPNMDSNSVASTRPNKKRRKSAEDHQGQLQDAVVEGTKIDAETKVGGGGGGGGEDDTKPRKTEKRKVQQDAPEDAVPSMTTNDEQDQDGEDAAVRTKQEKRQRRRAKKDARRAVRAAEAQTNDVAVHDSSRDDTANVEDMEVTELPVGTTPTKQEPPKSPSGVEWGRQEIRRILKRKQMEELVLSGKARWHKLPNDKWSIRYYQPGEAPTSTELSPGQERRHEALKQEIAMYEHTLHTSEQRERKRREEAEKENTMPVEEDAVAGAANDQVEDHEAVNVSSISKSGPKRKKRRRSEPGHAPVAENVNSQPEQLPDEPTSAPYTSGGKQDEDVAQTKPKSKKRKARQSVDSTQAAEEAETASGRLTRPVGAARSVEPSTKNKNRPRKKSKRGQDTQDTMDPTQGDQHEPHSGLEGSRKRSQERNEAPVEMTPRADDEYAPAASRELVSAERVRTWLDSHEESPQAGTNLPAPHVEVEQETTSRAPKPRKRRRKAPDAIDDDAAYEPQAEDEPVGHYEVDNEKMPKQHNRKPARTKTRRVSTEKHEHDPLAKSLQLAVPETTSGMFTEQEQEISDRIFDEVLQKHNYTEAELKGMIRNWRNAGVFKMEIEAALPNRKKDQVRKFCQRRYHAYERGPWTAEQDQALIDANAKWPGKWSKIADLVDRFAADCKDRWTTYLKFGENKEIGPWTQTEEDALVNAVNECIAKIRRSRRKDKMPSKRREDLEALIDWKTVAEMLGGKREGKRCREKYYKLMARLAKTGSLSQELPASQLQDELNSAAPRVESKKLRSKIAVNALENFEIGDYYDAFVEVHTAIKDHSAQYHDEQMVLWSIVAQTHPASRFNASYLGAALRRCAIEKALDEWEIDSKKIRRKLDEAQSIPAKALLLAKWVEKRSGDKLDTLPRKYMPELVGKTKEEIRQVRQQQQKQRRAKKLNARVKKSKDVVSESDEDDDDPLPTKINKPLESEYHESSHALSADNEALSKLPTVVADVSQAEDGSDSDEHQGSSQRRATRSIADHDDNDRDDHPIDDEDEAQPEIEESNRSGSQAPEAAHEVSDSEVDSTHEKVFAASQAARTTQGTQDVPETQPKPTHAGNGEASNNLTARVRSPDNDIVVSSVNSRVSDSPSLSPEDFVQRCRDAGRSQHGEYTSRNRRTYGRQSGSARSR